MARRTEIVNRLVTQLETISTVAKVERRYRFLDEINDFPTVTLGATPTEDYELYGDGQQLKLLRQSIRGYVYANRDDSLRESEALARDIESTVQQFESAARDLGVESAKVTTLLTDEGLMTPYGVAEVEVEVVYSG